MSELNKKAVEKAAEMSGLKVATVSDLLSAGYIFVQTLDKEPFWTRENLWTL